MPVLLERTQFSFADAATLTLAACLIVKNQTARPVTNVVIVVTGSTDSTVEPSVAPTFWCRSAGTSGRGRTWPTTALIGFGGRGAPCVNL
jgi:hypothetical protein